MKITVKFVPFTALFVFVYVGEPIVLLTVAFVLGCLVVKVGECRSVPVTVAGVFSLLCNVVLTLVLLGRLRDGRRFEGVLGICAYVALI